MSSLQLEDTEYPGYRIPPPPSPRPPSPDILPQEPIPENNNIDIIHDQNEPPPPPSTKKKTYTQTRFKHNSTTLEDNKKKTENLPWGDPMHKLDATDNNTFRLFFQNINGFETNSGMNDWHSFCQAIPEHSIGLAGLAETNLTWTHARTKQYRQAARKHLKHATITTSNSNEPCLTARQAGGTLTLINNQWNSRLHKSVADDSGMGRWTHVSFYGHNKQIIHVYTMYRVCQNSIQEAGPFTAFAQQWKALRKRDINTSPRKQVLIDLSREIQDLHAEGHLVIVMADANECILKKPTGEWAKFLEKTNLHDIHGLHHDPDTAPASYKRAQTGRIDYIVCSSALLPMVKACGTLAFEEGPYIGTDHRGLFVDFDSQALFKGKTNDIAMRQRRKLNSKDKKTVKKYILTLHKAIEKAKLIERAEDIPLRPKLSDSNREKLDQIDQELTELMLKAEEQCKREPYAWSPKLDHQDKIKKYWRLCLSHILNKPDLSHQIANMKDQIMQHTVKLDPKEPTHQLDDRPHEKEVASTKLRRSHRLLDFIRKQADKERQEYLAEAQYSASLQGNTKQARIMYRMQTQESRKGTYSTIKLYTKPDQDRSLATLEVPVDPDADPTAEETEWRRITDPKELDDALLQRNIKHFSQAQGTPFTEGELKQRLGHDGMTPTGDDILNGKQLDFDLDPATELLINHMQQKCKPMPEFKTLEITQEQLVQTFLHWRETTSTSPSGKHLGHYRSIVKAMQYQPDNPASPEDCKETDEVVEAANQIFFLHHHLIHRALNHCHAYSRWSKVHNVFFAKDRGSYKVHRLRVIHIFEADWQAINKIIVARQTIRHAEKKNSLPDTLGAGPGKMAIDTAVHRILQYEYLGASLTAAVCQYNDAAACYDRIIENQANLCLRALGCPKGALKLHSKVHKQFKFHPTTKLGVSQQFHQHTDEHPVHTPGQGGVDGPPRFTAVSITIMVSYEEKATGLELQTCINWAEEEHEPVTHKCIMYVDDGNTIHRIELNATPEEICASIKHNAQLWESILFATGGKLEIKKSVFQVIQWTMAKNGLPRMLSMKELPLTVPIKNSQTGKVHNLKQICPFESYKYLGVKMTANGNSSDQFDSLLKKSQHFADALAAAPLTRVGYHDAYFTVVLPSLTYSLAATNFTETQCETLQKRLLHRAILPGMGYNRNMPRAVVYGSQYFGGIGARHLYAEQGIAKVTRIIANVRANTKFAHTFRYVVDWYQLNAGLSRPILEDTRPVAGTRAPWMDSLRAFLRCVDSTIDYAHSWAIPPCRQNDLHIMEEALKYLPNATDQAIFNTCRQYLKVTTLAEIRDHADKAFVPGAFGEHHKHDPTRPILRDHFDCDTPWPQHQKPPASAWAKWTNTIHLINQQHRKRLGPWINPQDGYQPRGWFHWYNPTNQVYTHLHHDGTFTRFNTVSNRTTIRITTPCTDQSSQYAGTPVAVTNRTILNNLPDAQWECARLPPSPKITKEDTLQALEQHLWDTTNFRYDTKNLASPEVQQLFNTPNNLFQVCSDGGVRNQGAFAWVMSGNGKIIASGEGIVPGPLQGMFSFRTEAFGAWAGLLITWNILHHHKAYTPPAPIHPGYAESDDESYTTRAEKPPGKVTFYCDNLGVIKRLNRWYTYKTMYPNECLAADFDATMAALIVSRQFRRIHFEHVKGHQVDKGTPYSELSWPEKLNHDCDIRAGKVLDSLPDNPVDIDTPRLRGTDANLKTQGLSIHTSLTSHLRRAYSSQAIVAYLKDAWGWDNPTIDSIDWYGHGHGIYALDSPGRTFAIKFIHQWLPTNHKAHQVDECHPSQCPCCPCPDETQQHFMTCQQAQLTNHRWEATNHIRTYFEKTRTDPELQRLFFQGFDHWHRPRRLPTPQQYHRRYQHLILQQAEIGWVQLNFGRFALYWARLQSDYYYAQHKKHQNADNWISGLVAIILSSWRTVWNARCDIFHDNKGPEKAKERRHYHENKINSIFAIHEHLNAIDKDIIPCTQEEMLQWTTKKLEAWLVANEKDIRAAYKRAKSQDALNTKSLLSYSGFEVVPREKPLRPPKPKPQPQPQNPTKKQTKKQAQVTQFFQSKNPKPSDNYDDLYS